MKPITKPAFLVLATILCHMLFQKSVTAQSASVTEAHIMLDSISPTAVGCTFIVILGDTIDVGQVEVALGSAPGDTGLVFFTFGYDVTSGLPAGFTYQRDGLRLTLATGSVDRYPTWFGRVRTKDGAGNWNAPKLFVRN